MSNITPIGWVDKINSPELLAYLQQFGDEHFLSAEDINELRDKINLLIIQGNDMQFPDAVLVKGDVVKFGDLVSIAALAWTCRIDQQEYKNTNAFSTTISSATDGFYRGDILVLTKSSAIVKIQGTEDSDAVIEPDAPAGTIKIVNISVFGDTIYEPEFPIDINAYVPKLESTIKAISNTGIVSILQLESIETILSFNNAATEFHTIDAPINTFLYSGRSLFIKNNQSINIKLKHNISGAGNYNLFFPNEQDLILKPKEIGQFKLRFNGINSGVYEYIGVITELGTQIISAVEKIAIHDNDKVGIADSEDSNKTKYWKFSTIKATLKTYFDSQYLGIANNQEVTGIKTFLAGKFGLRNVANTFTSFFTNTNTASRTYTLQNRNGTLLDDTDLTSINASIATKQSVFTGVANYIIKSLNATTLVQSRLFDTGNKFGIGTIYTPAKDVTLGNQANREIGIEDSDSTVIGKDLIISAGRTVNFQLTSDFIPLGVGFQSWRGMSSSPNGDVYACTYGGDIYKQTAGTGSFSAQGQNSRLWVSMGGYTSNIYAVGLTDAYKRTGGTGSFVGYGLSGSNIWGITQSSVNNDVYYSVSGGSIYKQTGGTGSFVTTGATSLQWKGMCSNAAGDIFAVVFGGDIYKQTGGTGSFIGLGQTSRSWISIAVSPVNGDVYACVEGGDIYRQTGGTGSFVSLNQGNRVWRGITVNSIGNVYSCVDSGDIWMLNTQSLGTPNLDGGTKSEQAGTGKGTGKSRWNVWTGQKTYSGTDMQVLTKRLEIDENGNIIVGTDRIYANNAAAVAAGLPVRTFYWTTTGEMRIVV